MASSLEYRKRNRQHPPQRDTRLGRLHQSRNKTVSNTNTHSGQVQTEPKKTGFLLENSKENSGNSVPNTPFSLLKEEFSADDDDQSLLYSPAPIVKKENSTKSLRTTATSKSVHFEGKFSTGSYEEPLNSNSSVIDTADTNNLSSIIKSPEETQMGQVLGAKMVDGLPSPALPVDESPRRPPSLSAMHPKHSETPFSVNKKGLCMDLSHVFGASTKQSTVNPKGTTPARPPRRSVVKTTKKVHHSSHRDQETLGEREELMFTNWLNQMLCPIDDVETETGAFRILVRQQKLSQLRFRARHVFQSIHLDRLMEHISKGKLQLREDNDVSANLGCRKQLIDLLFSYSPNWLRIGLETVFSTVLSSNDRSLLRKFIVSNVVQDEDILNKYTHGKCKVPSGSFEVSYRNELRKIVLFRVLSLVCFLDVAKHQKILDLPLFHVKAQLKSTQKLLFRFCREFMKGEGNIVKHLTRLGLDVSVEQSAKEELEFRINNIKVDLCDGIRLTRLAEILSGQSLVPRLRLPVVSRLQKFHNVKVALQGLQGIPESILPHHIVDGHRQQVLRFLWSVVAYYCLPNLLTRDEVVEEIQRIRAVKQMEATKSSCDRLESALLQWSRLICSFYDFDVRNLEHSFSDGKAVCYLIHYYHPEFIDLRLVTNKPRVWNFAEAGMLSLGGIPVFIPDAKEEPVTLCLSFLCSRMMETRKQVAATRVIQLSFRRFRTRELGRKKISAARKILKFWRLNKPIYYKNQARLYARPVRTIESYMLRYRQTFVANLRLRKEDHERAVIAIVRIQRFARTVIIRKQLQRAVEKHSAASKIQAQVRCFQTLKFYRQIHERNMAATRIQRATMRMLQLRKRQYGAVVVIQAYWRRFNEQMNLAVAILDIIDIQRCIRGFLGRRKRDIMLNTVTLLQSVARRFIATKNVRCARATLALIKAVVSIQSAFRCKQAVAAALNQRRLREACISIQNLWRRHKARQAFFELKATLEQKRAVIKIQAFVRVPLSKKKLRRLRNMKKRQQAATAVQTFWRAILAVRTAAELREALIRRRSAISIQAFCRMVLGQFVLEKLKRNHMQQISAIAIQARWRCCKQNSMFLVTKSSIIKIQAICRRRSEQHFYWTMRHYIVIVQCTWRVVIAKQMLAQAKGSAVVIQAFFRRLLCISIAQKRLIAVVQVQSFARALLSKNELLRRKQTFALHSYSASVIQRFYRGYNARLNYKLFLNDLCLVQSCVRRYLTLIFTRRQRLLIITAQKYIRRLLARKVLFEMKEEDRRLRIQKLFLAVRIQAFVRGYRTRAMILNLSRKAIRIQSLLRGAFARSRYEKERANIIVVQCKARQWLSFRHRERLIFAISRLQCWIRCCKARRERTRLIAERELRRLEEFSTLIIQCSVRQYQAQRRLYREISARKIQKTWRCYAVHVYFMTCVVSALEIQTWTRRYFAMCQYDCRYEAVLFLQALARGFLCRREQRLHRLAATTLQSMFRVLVAKKRLHVLFIESYAASIIASVMRMYLARKQFVYRQTSARILQSQYRGCRQRSKFQNMIRAAQRIQASFRKFVSHCRFKVMKSAAILIQTRARMILAVELTTQMVCRKIVYHRRLNACAKKIQRAWSNWLELRRMKFAAIKIQGCFIRLVNQNRYERLRFHTIQLQAIVRGRIVRRWFSKRERILSKRIASANTFARSHPEYRLANRSRAALAKVLRSKSLIATMKAIWVLELSTRLSYDFCESFTQSGAVVILFRLMNECNRSLPHLKLQYGILLTLSNVLKYDEFVKYIISKKTLAMLISFLHLFQDNQCLFAQTLLLFGRLIRFVANPSQFCGSDDTRRFLAVVRVYSRKYNHKVNMTQSTAGPLLPIVDGLILDRQQTLVMANGLVMRFGGFTGENRKGKQTHR